MDEGKLVAMCTSAKLSRVVLGGVLVVTVCTSQATGQGKDVGAVNRGALNAPNVNQANDISELKRQVKAALAHMDELQNKLDTGKAEGDFQQQLNDERTRLVAIENRIDELELTPAVKNVQTTIGRGAEATPGITSGLAPADIYNDGFFNSTADKSFSLYLNGLFQIRYTGFSPHENVGHFGGSTQPSSNFDVYLGRFAASGTVFSPTLKYFLQFQGSTASNGNGITLLDCFTTKTISKYVTLQAGRSWTPYTYEFYVNPGDLLLPDISSAEYAFGLSRTIGVQAYGQAGKLSYAAMVANSIPALDASGHENFNTKVSYIGHFQYDILAPYGYAESDPGPLEANKPALTFWGSAAYNPVASDSSFENLAAGDRTANATSTLAFRYMRFTSQSTGYYRKTTPVRAAPAFNSWGFAQQAGFYILPGKLELAGRVSGVNWGAPNFPGSGFRVDTWFSGPNFPYHRIDEDTLGINYYFHGHNAKLQVAYSYLHGNAFDGQKFGANRVWVQSQVMF
jgi:phosphate-selective porin OprO/OprP